MICKTWVRTLGAAFLLAGLALFGCAADQIAGGGTETGHARGTLVAMDGTPASGVQINLRPNDYLPTIAEKVAARLSYRTSATTQTDSLGNFEFDSIAAGVYSLECLEVEGGNGTLIDLVIVEHADSTTEIATDTLKPLGSIAGKIQLPESLNASHVRVLVYGLDRITVPDSAGNYVIPGIPEGRYSLRFLALLGQFQGFDVHGVLVVSGDTTRPPNVVLPGADKIYAPKTSGAIVMDGVFDEADWGVALGIDFSRPTVTENTVTVKALWDTVSLYIAYQVLDTSLRIDLDTIMGILRGIDAAEFFIDPEHDASPGLSADDRQFRIDILNNQNVVRDSTKLQDSVMSAVDTTTGGYNIEIAIPWVLLSKLPAAGLVMGALFGNDDDDSGVGVQFDWLNLVGNISGQAWKHPNLWGDLVLLP